mmetsp:Transcript_24487/g.65764  ORF Transcript_24487/g.65764 Transcript_24487/m.65764 type:complete len:317 (-) Transcript_24487:379-1329(-)
MPSASSVQIASGSCGPATTGSQGSISWSLLTRRCLHGLCFSMVGRARATDRNCSCGSAIVSIMARCGMRRSTSSFDVGALASFSSPLPSSSSSMPGTCVASTSRPKQSFGLQACLHLEPLPGRTQYLQRWTRRLLSSCCPRSTSESCRWERRCASAQCPSGRRVSGPTACSVGAGRWRWPASRPRSTCHMRPQRSRSSSTRRWGCLRLCLRSIACSTSSTGATSSFRLPHMISSPQGTAHCRSTAPRCFQPSFTRPRTRHSSSTLTTSTTWRRGCNGSTSQHGGERFWCGRRHTRTRRCGDGRRSTNTLPDEASEV